MYKRRFYVSALRLESPKDARNHGVNKLLAHDIVLWSRAVRLVVILDNVLELKRG